MMLNDPRFNNYTGGGRHPPKHNSIAEEYDSKQQKFNQFRD